MNRPDASAAAFLARAKAVGGPSLDQLSAQKARHQFSENYHADKNPLEEVASVTEFENKGISLKCWHGIGAPATDAPALLYLHGGGWLFGSPETHEDICRMIANRARAIMVAPDYRLAPEHPFPAGLEDCANALQYLHDHPRELGLDPTRISVGGDSSGGNMAAVLALMARDGDLPPLAIQLLIDPNTEQSQSSESFRKFASGYGLTSAEMAWFRDHYLTTTDQRKDWRAAPLLAKTLSGVAPAVVILAGHDIFYDEGLRYADRLAAESRAIVKTWPSQIHGFFSLDRHMPETSEAISALCAGWASLSDNQTA